MPQALDLAATAAQTTTPYRRITWRLLPLLLVCYLFAHLDRINIGFAKAQMSADLHFSDTVYGFGAGLFFIAYALCGVPSNLALERVGPRRWIATLMVVWGLLSAGMFLVQTPGSFYLLRLLLGAAEAGFFPGILVYLARWFPARRRGSVTALFALAVPLAGMLGGPLSGALLEAFREGPLLRGWQWMFLLEGLPVVLLGLLVLRALPDGYQKVHWLDERQKACLHEDFAQEEAGKPVTSAAGLLRSGHLWLLVAIYCGVMLAVNTLAFWMPALIHGAGIGSDGQVGLLSALPYLAGCLFMLAAGRSSDRHRERRWHLCVPLLMAALGLALASLLPQAAWPVMLGLVLAGMGAAAALPQFWQLPPAFLGQRTLAAGIGLISSLGSIASFGAPFFIGWMRDTTQSSALALQVLAVLIALGALLVLRTPACLVNPQGH